MMLDAIDKYKFGLLAVFATYIGLFMYMQMDTYDTTYIIETGFESKPQIIDEEQIELNSENMDIPPDMMDDFKAISGDSEDDRETSKDDFSQYRSKEQIAQDIKNLEQQMKDEAGGASERAEIQKEIDKRKEEQRKLDERNKQNNDSSSGGSNKKYEGNVMVEERVSKRSSNRLPIPGYLCNNRNQVTIIVKVQVNRAGTVTSASFLQSGSSGATQCTIDQSVAYAKKSRFNYSSSAPESQSGTIVYIFSPR